MAKIRYNRLLDIFAGVTCYSLQNICRPVAAQFLHGDVIALMEFEQAEDSIQVAAEKHYKLVKPEDLSAEELRKYQQRSD